MPSSVAKKYLTLRIGDSSCNYENHRYSEYKEYFDEHFSSFACLRDTCLLCEVSCARLFIPTQHRMVNVLQTIIFFNYFRNFKFQITFQVEIQGNQSIAIEAIKISHKSNTKWIHALKKTCIIRLISKRSLTFV